MRQNLDKVVKDGGLTGVAIWLFVQSGSVDGNLRFGYLAAGVAVLLVKYADRYIRQTEGVPLTGG